MRRLRYPVIVEGRYDKSRLASVVQGEIITTDGFGVFRDGRRLELIRRLAERDCIIVLTDSDRAGFRIRAAISGAVPPERIIHVYIPEIAGKEPRKASPSAEGTLGVEGVPCDILLCALEAAGAFEDSSAAPPRLPITAAMLYELGFSGRENSARLRSALRERLDLPRGISAKALPAILSRLMTADEFAALARELNAAPDDD